MQNSKNTWNTYLKYRQFNHCPPLRSVELQSRRSQKGIPVSPRTRYVRQHDSLTNTKIAGWPTATPTSGSVTVRQRLQQYLDRLIIKHCGVRGWVWDVIFQKKYNIYSLSYRVATGTVVPRWRFRSKLIKRRPLSSRRRRAGCMAPN